MALAPSFSSSWTEGEGEGGGGGGRVSLNLYYIHAMYFTTSRIFVPNATCGVLPSLWQAWRHCTHPLAGFWSEIKPFFCESCTAGS